MTNAVRTAWIATGRACGGSDASPPAAPVPWETPEARRCAAAGFAGEPASDARRRGCRTVCEKSEPRPAMPVAMPIWRNVELIPLAIRHGRG